MSPQAMYTDLLQCTPSLTEYTVHATTCTLSTYQSVYIVLGTNYNCIQYVHGRYIVCNKCTLYVINVHCTEYERRAM